MKIEKDKNLVENIMDLNLYKQFGHPKVKELGIMLPNGYHVETVGEIYEVVLDELPDITNGNLSKGKSLILFSKQDIKKLLQFNVGAVEIEITNESKLVIINHYFHDHHEEQE